MGCWLVCLSPVSSLINTPAECWSVAGHRDTETEGRQEADLSTEGREGACTAALHCGNGQSRSGGGYLFMLKYHVTEYGTYGTN